MQEWKIGKLLNDLEREVIVIGDGVPLFLKKPQELAGVEDKFAPEEKGLC